MIPKAAYVMASRDTRDTLEGFVGRFFIECAQGATFNFDYYLLHCLNGATFKFDYYLLRCLNGPRKNDRACNGAIEIDQ